MPRVVVDTHAIVLYLCADPRRSRVRFPPVPLPRSTAPPPTPSEEVPDLPDRVIAATALALNLPLISRDGKIKASRLTTVW